MPVASRASRSTFPAVFVNGSTCGRLSIERSPYRCGGRHGQDVTTVSFLRRPEEKTCQKRTPRSTLRENSIAVARGRSRRLAQEGGTGEPSDRVFAHAGSRLQRF